MTEEQINEVMRLADEIADYAWKEGVSDGAYSNAKQDRECRAESRTELEAYLRTLGKPENTFPLNPNGASKWAYLKKHDGAEAIGVVFRTGSGSVGSLVDGRVVWADWLAHPNGSKPESVNAELLSALKSAKTGLEWYQDTHPESASECDNEAMQEIDAAIARAESAIEGRHKHLEPWQPIETAPHDEVLLLTCEFDGPGDWRFKCGYFDDDRGCWKVWGASWVPTRWAAIPTPPNLAAARRDQAPAKVSPTTAAPIASLKPHVFRELVNDLRDLAKQYHGHDSLRERISGRLAQDVPVVSPCAGHAVQQDADEQRQVCWSCKTPTSALAISEADGNCPFCGVEICQQEADEGGA